MKKLIITESKLKKIIELILTENTTEIDFKNELQKLGFKLEKEPDNMVFIYGNENFDAMMIFYALSRKDFYVYRLEGGKGRTSMGATMRPKKVFEKFYAYNEVGKMLDDVKKELPKVKKMA
jgi:hypothetical protein